jgi:hypothetical protein
MSCLNEILSKNYVPAQYKEYITLFFTNTTNIVVHATPFFSNDCHCKLIQLLELFIGNHMKRIESIQSLPVIELLGTVWKYTFQIQGVENYLNILQVWDLLLDYLITVKEQRNPSYEQYL